MNVMRYQPALAVALALAVSSCARSELAVLRHRAEPAPGVVRLTSTPERRKPDASEDFLEHAVRRPLRYVLIPPRALRDWVGNEVESYNPTADDDVLASSWFSHRNGRRRMSPEEVFRGPGAGAGPDTSGTWTVIAAKVEGITPGFRIRDAAGIEYLIKFDPPGHPELMSSAEAISQRLFHAAGYHTPATYVTYFDPARVRASDALTFEDERGRKLPVSDGDLQEMLRKFRRAPDGRLRAVATRILSGIDIGPFGYEGTRKDDPADTVPHQHRRELRGLYVLAAWLNHLDTKQLNTLDVVVGEDGHRFVKHYLIDFGSTLWSSSIYPNGPRDGVEFDFDLGNIAARLVTAGVYSARWERYQPHDAEATLGFYAPDLFDPARWRSNYSNPAFKLATVRDAYWGAKLVASFDEAQIRAAVSAGQLSDPGAEELLVQAILARRDITVRYWFQRVTPLEDLAIINPTGAAVTGIGLEASRLSFRDLAVAEGIVPAQRRVYALRLAIPSAGFSVEARQQPRISPGGGGLLELPALPGDVRDRLNELPVERRVARLELEAVVEPGRPDPRSVRIYLLPDRHGGYRIVGRAY